MILLLPNYSPVATLLLCALLVLSQRIIDAAPVSNHHNKQQDGGRRQVWAWASESALNDTIKQLYGEPDLIDGIELFCGCSFTETGLVLNEIQANACRPLIQTAKETNTKVQLLIGGKVPESAGENVGHFVIDALKVSRHFGGLHGFSLDDETDCAPRATTGEFEKWMVFHNAFAHALAFHGFSLTSAIQGVFAIEGTRGNDPCGKKPSAYDLNERVVSDLATAFLQKWLVMDTYYFSTGRFMGALDWHVQHIPLDLLAFGMMNRDDLSEDDLVARFHAIERTGVDWINIFLMPIDNGFLPFLKRWKSHCAGCGKQTILGCYDMTIQCNVDDDLYAERRPMLE